MNEKIIIHNNVADLYQALVTRWATIADQAIKERGSFHVALAGGSTPEKFYQLLATMVDTLPWLQTHIYFGDERCVAPDHSDSNYRMASQALLAQVPIPEHNIHRMAGENPNHEQAAADYQQSLEQSLPQDTHGYHFDLVLLGLGPDGHIASLFPDTDILKLHQQLVAPVYVEKFSSWRISITFPVLAQARHVLLIVAGSGKAEIVKQVLGEKSADFNYPVQQINTDTEWHLDKAAASLFKPVTSKDYYDQDSGC